MFNFIKNLSDTPLWKEQIKSRIHLRDVNLKHWLDNNVFSPVWWFMLISVILIWFVWWELVKKSKLLEIVTYGLFITLLSLIIDITGTENILWGYPNMLVPLAPPLLFADLCVIPVIYMLIYQYFTSWKSFIVVSTISGFLNAFVWEPIAIYLQIYQMTNWKHIYSFPLYIIVGLLFKKIMCLIMKVQNTT
jgi:hypothetical protein